jgi:hypothetical protein
LAPLKWIKWDYKIERVNDTSLLLPISLQKVKKSFYVFSVFLPLCQKHYSRKRSVIMVSFSLCKAVYSQKLFSDENFRRGALSAKTQLLKTMIIFGIGTKHGQD